MVATPTGSRVPWATAGRPVGRRAAPLSPEVLLAARAEFRVGWARYQQDRSQLQDRAGASAAMFALPDGTAAQVREHVDSFAATLGRTSGVAEQIFAQVRAGLCRR